MSFTENLILLGEYGSVAQGTATDQSDHDYMAIVVETQAQVIGLDTYETKRKSDAKQGEKSKPGESDTTYHGLRKFASLAAAGNPTVGSILHLPQYDTLTEVGRELVEHRHLFWSKKAGYSYLGYLDSQIKQLNDEKRKRPELVEAHGYDIKFGYHAYRLAIQGIHYMLTGSPGIPLEGHDLAMAKAIRAGQMEYPVLMLSLSYLREQLRKALVESEFDIPERADYAGINKLLVSIHEDVWAHGTY